MANFGITLAEGWSSPTDGSPDFMDSLSRSEYHVPQNIGGYQYAQDSSRYFGMVIFSKISINAREYIQGELQRLLIKDSTYCFQLFISLGDSSNYAVKNNLGIYFSPNSFYREGNYGLNYIPQIEFIDSEHFFEKINWVKYSALYIASGDENFITIGNFNNDESIDTMFIGNGGKQLWHDATYYYIDNLYLGHCDSIPEDSSIGLRENQLDQQVSIYPNPIREHLFIKYGGNEQLQLRLYNIVGQSVEIKPQQTGKQVQVSVNHLSKGVYFLEMIAGKQRVSHKIIKR